MYFSSILYKWLKMSLHLHRINYTFYKQSHRLGSNIFFLIGLVYTSWVTYKLKPYIFITWSSLLVLYICSFLPKFIFFYIIKNIKLLFNNLFENSISSQINKN